MNRIIGSRLLIPALVTFCLCLFIAIGSYDISAPGLYYDEALFVNAASGGVTDLFVHKRVAGVPVMLMPYIGALKAWLYFPIFKLFGIDLVTIRLPVVLLGALAMALTWRYVQQQFGTLAGVLFVLMASVEPSSVFHSRLDWGPTALMMVFRAGLLLALTNWFATGERRSLKWALIWVGFGLFDKLNFIWIATSALTAGLLVYPDRYVQGRVLNKRAMLIWLGWGLLALGLFVAVLNGLGVRLFKEIGISDGGARAALFFDLLGMTIRGAGVFAFVIQGDQQIFHLQSLALGVVAVVAVFGLVAKLRSGAWPMRRLVYLTLFMLILGVQIFLTKKATGPHHFATFAPFWLIFLAVGVAGAVDSIWSHSRSFAWMLGAVCVAMVMVTSFKLDLTYLASFRQAGINPFWEPTSSSLITETLESNKDVKTVVTVDWGIGTNVQALSNNRLKVIDLWPMFNEELNERSLNWIRTEFIDQGAAFVVHVKGREAFPATRARFLEAMSAKNWPLNHVSTIQTADGEPYLEVYIPRSPQP